MYLFGVWFCYDYEYYDIVIVKIKIYGKKKIM